MKAMVLDAPEQALRLVEVPTPVPGPDDVLLEVEACAVCRTDLHIVDGDLTEAKLPLVPGHEIVGRVAAMGAGVRGLTVGQRVGVPWLGGTCGHCRYCLKEAENLCDTPVFTGYTRDGGFAEQCLADARFVVKLPDDADPAHLAPLLCAGLIGHRSLGMTGEARRLGLYGFGAAAHIVAQVARWQGREVFAFTRPGDSDAQDLARRLGAVWAGGSDETPAEPLDAAIIFAPVGALVPVALRAVAKGGTVVCGGIHMSDIPGFPYQDLWGERVIRSVANLTRADATDFFGTVAEAGIRTEVTRYALEDANAALSALREGQISGAAVLMCGQARHEHA
ncbi:MAG: zinc-dependent alcohol dehydrogenase family protein [Minwuia sp.]|nr:zinc-dependent alcohol dehydrogenase family protein [Minwuia sp.]